MAFTTQEVVYYVVMWIFTFAAGLLRTLRDHEFVSPWDCLAVGGVGGFYGFAVVAIFSYYGPSVADFGWGYFGGSVAIGSLGKEQDRITRAIFSKAFSKFIDEDKK